MKRFAVYLTPDENLEKTVFVREGFCFQAFFLTIFWTLYKRLYSASFFLFLLITVTQFLLYNGNISSFTVATINLVGLQLFCGLSGADWIQNSLLRKKFKLAGVIFAANIDDAQIKFFSEYNMNNSDNNIESAW